MKRIILAAVLAASIFLFCPAGLADAAPEEDPVIIGISQLTDKGLRLGIDDKATVAYPDVTWYVFLPADTHVTGADPEGSIIDDNLTAGLYIFTRSYEPGEPAEITWSIGGDVSTFELKIASSAAMAHKLDKPDNTIEVTPEFLTQEEREIAGGCIILALVPCLFIVPYWIRRKQEDFYEIF